jgi:hypothetical protein
VSFTALVQDVADLLSGSIDEVVPGDGATSQSLSATMQGRRQGREVIFLKTYDEPSRSYDTVQYAGELSSDGTEIEGTWTIPGSWSGTFLMIRSGQGYASAEAKTAERSPVLVPIERP